MRSRHPPSFEGIKARGGNGGLGPFLCRWPQNWHGVRATRAPQPFTIAGMGSSSGIQHPSGAELRTHALDRRVAELARRQHAVVSRQQLLALGMGRRAIVGRLERGQLHEVFRGVYVVGVRRISRCGRWMAAVLACGEGAVLSHRSAGRLWRILPPAAEWVDVTCPRTEVER
jgi:hypothetical protein